MDGSTLQALLEPVSFTAQNSEVTLGWVQLRRPGPVLDLKKGEPNYGRFVRRWRGGDPAAGFQG